MIKLKLLFQLLKNNWKIPIYLLLAFFVIKGYWDKQQELNASYRREYNLKAIIFKATKGLRTTAKVNKDLEGVYLLEKKISAHWKAIALSGSGTQTELDSNRTKVEFDTTDACISLEGFTLTNPPYYELDIKRQSFSLDIKVTDFENNIYSWTSTSDCIGLDNVHLEVAPDLKGVCKDGFDKGEFILGGIIAIGGVLAYVALR